MTAAKQNPTIRLPEEIDFEKELLGSLLCQNGRLPAAIKAVSPHVRPEAFAVPQHGEILRALIGIIADGETFTPATLYARVSDHVRDAGDLQALADVGIVEADDILLERLANIIRNAHIKRQTLRILDKAAREPMLCDTEYQASTFHDDIREQLDTLDVKRSGGPLTLDLTKMQPKQVSWLWERRIPRGMISVLAGPGEHGKSWLTLDIAARLSNGLGWPDSPKTRRKPGGTLLVTYEDTIDCVTLPRLIGAGADLKYIRPFNLSDVWFDLSGLRILEEALDEVPSPELLIIDPLGSALPRDVDSHRDADTRRVLAPLSKLAERRNIAVLLVCHTGKTPRSGLDQAVTKILGSVGIANAARAISMVFDDPDDTTRQRRLLAPAKCNLIPRDTPSLAFRIDRPAAGHDLQVLWDAEPVQVHADDLAKPPPEKSRRPRDDAGDFLRLRLADGPAHREAVEADAEDQDITKRTLARAKRDLQVVCKQGLWALPVGGTE